MLNKKLTVETFLAREGYYLLVPGFKYGNNFYILKQRKENLVTIQIIRL